MRKSIIFTCLYPALQYLVLQEDLYPHCSPSFSLPTPPILALPSLHGKSSLLASKHTSILPELNGWSVWIPCLIYNPSVMDLDSLWEYLRASRL